MFCSFFFSLFFAPSKAFTIATTMSVDIKAWFNDNESILNVELTLTVAELAEQVQRVFSLTGQSIELELDGSVMPSSFGLSSFTLNEDSVVNVSVTSNGTGVIIPVSPTVGFSGLTPDKEEELVAKITLKEGGFVPASNKIAKEWIKGLFTGDLFYVKSLVRHVAVLPSRTDIKIHTHRISTSQVSQYIMPILTRIGEVKVFNESEKIEQSVKDAATRKRREEQRVIVGDFKATNNSVSQLAAIHGTDGGSSKKRRRYARQGQSMLHQSFKIASSGLREGREDTDDSSNEN